MSAPDRDRWPIVSPYLDRALGMEDEERAAWLESLRATDATLASEIEAWLEEHRELARERFLEGGRSGRRRRRCPDKRSARTRWFH